MAFGDAMTAASISLRQAKDADQPFDGHLEEVCMRAYAVALWGEWRPEPPEASVAGRHGIVVCNGLDAGCIETTLHVDHLFLDKLYLLPSFQRRGVGAVVLRQVVAEAKHFGVPLRLSVLTTNPAQAFYRREGLQVRERNAERSVFEANHGYAGVKGKQGRRPT